MTREEWELVQNLYGKAQGLAEAERSDFLQNQCAYQPGLYRLISELLEAGEQCGTFLEPPEIPIESHVEKTLTGKMLGEYRLLSEIGRGGMAVVYLAEQVSLQRQVAVKIVDSHLLHGKKRRERFKREARAASRLKHPNIVHVLSSGEEDGLLYYAMEYVQGQSLRESLDQCLAEADPHRSASMVSQLASALAYVHKQHIVHRDIKPENILLDVSGIPKLVDFGIARDLDNKALSQTGDMAGTVLYMSPEQAAAKESVSDYRTDIYSLGAVLYEMLTLEPPHKGEHAAECIYNITFTRPQDPRRLNRSIPGALAAICLKALEKDPSHRYQQAADFAEDLQRFLEGRPTLAEPPSWLRRAAQRLTERPQEPARLRVAAGLGLLSVVACASYVMVRAGEDSKARSDLGALHAQIITLLEVPAWAKVKDPAIAIEALAFQQELAVGTRLPMVGTPYRRGLEAYQRLAHLVLATPDENVPSPQWWSRASILLRDLAAFAAKGSNQITREEKQQFETLQAKLFEKHLVRLPSIPTTRN